MLSTITAFNTLLQDSRFCEMSEEELKQEQAEVEEHEEETSPPLVRKSRTGDDNEVSNGVSESNGHAIQLQTAQNKEMMNPAAEEQKVEETGSVLENGQEFSNEEQKIEDDSRQILENETEFINGEHKEEESDGILENETEFMNGEHKEEESNGALENETEFMNGEHKEEESNGALENETEFMNGEQKKEESEGDELKFTNGELEIEETHGVLENASEFMKGKHETEESDSVPQIETGAINGELKLENLVFHDKDEGVNSTSAHIAEEQILKGPEPVELDISEINEEIEENSFSSSNIQHSDSSFEEGGTSHYEASKEIESAEIDLINEDDLEITELDVERVIQKQTTHDLYCPNCKSCITKRVILRKRKRRIKIADEDVKRNKTGRAVGPKLGTVSTQSPEIQVHQEGEGEVDIDDAQEPKVDEHGRDREPDIFRCLSCFSIFIPTGDGFKLFKRNWFTKIFTQNKHETAVDQGSSSQTNVRQSYTAIPSSDSAYQSGQPSFSKDTGSPSHSSEGFEGAAGINIARDGIDTPLLKPSVYGKVNTLGVGGKLDMKTTEAVGEEGTTGINATHEDGNKALNFPDLRPFLKWKPANGVKGKFDMTATEAVDVTVQKIAVFTSDQPKESKPIQEFHVNRDIDSSVATLPLKNQVTNIESAEDGISLAQQNGLQLLITSNKGSPVLKNIEEGIKKNQKVQTGDKEAIQLSPPSASVIQASDVDGNLNISVSIPHEQQDVTATIVTKSVLESKNVDSRSSDGGEVYPAEVSQQIITETKINFHPHEPITTEISSALLDAPVAKDNDTVITIDRQPPTPSHVVEGTILPTVAATATQSETQASTADRGERKIEVIKSIVYGGLAESITSLSVVSSAGGGGAATLNVVALGAANLIGGLFVISHNLWDLRCDRDEQVSNQITEQKDRYRELLGRRQNFVLHAVVAIISYLTFGLVCPVVYGFSFRGSDDKQFKLMVAAAASLVCILILAIAKAYVQRPPKPYLKTVLTYMIVGFMVSGVSYAAGELVERLLEKLGLFEASSAAPNLEMKPFGTGWASY